MTELTSGTPRRKLLRRPTHKRERETPCARAELSEPLTIEIVLNNAKKTLHTRVAPAPGSRAHARNDVQRDRPTLFSPRTVRPRIEPFGAPASCGWALRGAPCLIHRHKFQEENHG